MEQHSAHARTVLRWLLQAALILVVSHGITVAQPFQFDLADSTYNVEEFSDSVYKVPLAPVSLGECGRYWYDCPVIDSQHKLDSVVEHATRIHKYSCKDYSPPAIDFSTHLLLVIHVFADCNARVGLQLVRDDVQKQYRLYIIDEYGGCRGMRTQTLTALAPQLPAGYTLVQIDKNLERGYGEY